MSPVGIAKGEEWGQSGLLPSDAPVASSDSQAADYLQAGTPIIGLEAGDLARTLGIRAPYDRTSSKHLVPVDAIEVELDDGSVYQCLAHTVVGNVRWRRGTVALMNAAFLESRNIAPRAHPGDGKVDVVRLDLELADRMKAWKRMVTGTHVPHPGIEIRRRSEGLVELKGTCRVHVDGRSVGRTRTLRYRLIPAAIVVAVS